MYIRRHNTTHRQAIVFWKKFEKVSCTEKFRILHFSSINFHSKYQYICTRKCRKCKGSKKKKGKICHRFIIEIRAGSSIEFEIPKRYGGCDNAGQSNWIQPAIFTNNGRLLTRTMRRISRENAMNTRTSIGRKMEREKFSTNYFRPVFVLIIDRNMRRINCCAWFVKVSKRNYFVG